MWLLHMEEKDKFKILHARNGREYRLPELPHYSVDGYCAETRRVFEFMGCSFHGCKCQTLRDLKTLYDDTLAERYEKIMLRIEQIANAGYTVKVMWECQIVSPKIVERKPHLLHTLLCATIHYTNGMPFTVVERRPCVFTTRYRRTLKQFIIKT